MLSAVARASKCSSSNGDAVVGKDGRCKYLESLIRADYERCHPEDSFADLKHRARFSKEDKGLLRDWLAVAEWRDRSLRSRTTLAAE